MYENVPFFGHMHSKYAKSATMIQKLFLQTQCGVSKKAELVLIPNSLKKAQKCAGKKLQAHFLHIFPLTFAYNFFLHIF
jgi:hypothetical protein